MKTTIELPDSLHRSIKLRAVENGTTLRDFIVSSLQASLRQGEGKPFEGAGSSHSKLDAEGWPLLQRTGNDVIPDAVLRELREQEGV
ncbi:MAG: hypothetical protein ACOYMS_02715 [Terrimicrobiaceae bacterium]